MGDTLIDYAQTVSVSQLAAHLNNYDIKRIIYQKHSFNLRTTYDTHHNSF